MDEWVIDAAGRLSHGGTGEIIFGGPSQTPLEELAGITNVGERITFVHDVLNTWMGDSNLDGEFNSSDFVFLRLIASSKLKFELSATVFLAKC